MPLAAARPAWEFRFTRGLCHGALQLPLAVVTISELVRGWRPTSDDANIAMRASQVFTAHSPMVGQFTQATQNGHHPTYDLGPLLYWVLAVPVRIDAQQGVLWGSALFLSLAMVLVVEAAWSVGRRPATIAATALMATVLIAEPRLVADPAWNPYVATVWTMVAAAAAWALANGHARWLPVLVLACSVASQSHLAAVIPSAVLVVVGIGLGIGPPVVAAIRGRSGHGNLLSAFRSRFGHLSSTGGGPDASPTGERSGAGSGPSAPLAPWARPAMVAGAVALACWFVPLLQQMTASPGNISLLLHGVSDGPSFGLVHGLDAMGSTIVPWPVWLDGHQATTFFGALVAIDRPGLVLSLVALTPLVAVAALRRVFGPVQSSAALIVLLVVLADAATVAAIPMSGLLNVVYLFPIEWPAGIAAVVLTAIAAGRLVAWAAPRLMARIDAGIHLRARVRRRWARLAGTVGLVVSGALVVTSTGPLVTRAWPAPPTLGGWQAVDTVKAVSGYLERVLPKGPFLLRTPGGGTIADYEVIFGVAWQLHVDGRQVHLVSGQAAYASATLAPPPSGTATTVYVHDAGERAAVLVEEGGRPVAARTFPA